MIGVDATTAAGTAPGLSRLPPLEVIAAVAANGVIGAGNRMPWHIGADLRRFRALTSGHAVIMGRRTFESIGRPLPQRQNIVVTRTGFVAAGIETAASLDAALALVALPAPAYCIGGAALYRDALPRASVLHLTEIARDFEGDATFPRVDPAVWREVAREVHSADMPGTPGYAFVTYTRERA